MVSQLLTDYGNHLTLKDHLDTPIVNMSFMKYEADRIMAHIGYDDRHVAIIKTGISIALRIIMDMGHPQIFTTNNVSRITTKVLQYVTETGNSVLDFFGNIMNGEIPNLDLAVRDGDDVQFLFLPTQIFYDVRYSSIDCSFILEAFKENYVDNSDLNITTSQLPSTRSILRDLKEFKKYMLDVPMFYHNTDIVVDISSTGHMYKYIDCLSQFDEESLERLFKHGYPGVFPLSMVNELTGGKLSLIKMMMVSYSMMYDPNSRLFRMYAGKEWPEIYSNLHYTDEYLRRTLINKIVLDDPFYYDYTNDSMEDLTFYDEYSIESYDLNLATSDANTALPFIEDMFVMVDRGEDVESVMLETRNNTGLPVICLSLLIKERRELGELEDVILSLAKLYQLKDLYVRFITSYMDMRHLLDPSVKLDVGTRHDYM